MKIAIASGKGGTGKTTVATNLAWLASQNGLATAYLDCDTEAPNGHLFLRPVIEERREVVRMIPQVDVTRCTLGGQCTEICQFSAIVCLGQKILTFPELCHSCSGCQLVCPTHAISETPRAVGVVETGSCGALRFVQGRLNVGETSSPPVIRAVKQAAPPAQLLIYDAPPGTTCPMIETVRGSDYVLLVTEPTPFGMHDLRLAVEVVKSMKKSFGVVINRALSGVRETRQFCQQARIPILAEIPDVMAIAEAYSEGRLAVEAVPGMRRTFAKLLLELTTAVQTKALPETVRLNLNQIVYPPAEPASRHRQTADGQPVPICYLALRARGPKSNRV
jgi:MinD superfamily P-loop ATPase